MNVRPLRHIALPALAAAALLLFASPAVAQEQPIAIHGVIPHGHVRAVRTVKFDDIDLATTAGENELYKRIARAVSEVCGGSHHQRQHYLRHDIERCSSAARLDARAQVANAIAAAQAAHLKGAL